MTRSTFRMVGIAAVALTALFSIRIPAQGANPPPDTVRVAPPPPGPPPPAGQPPAEIMPPTQTASVGASPEMARPRPTFIDDEMVRSLRRVLIGAPPATREPDPRLIADQ